MWEFVSCRGISFNPTHLFTSIQLLNIKKNVQFSNEDILSMSLNSMYDFVTEHVGSSPPKYFMPIIPLPRLNLCFLLSWLWCAKVISWFHVRVTTISVEKSNSISQWMLIIKGGVLLRRWGTWLLCSPQKLNRK